VNNYQKLEKAKVVPRAVLKPTGPSLKPVWICWFEHMESYVVLYVCALFQTGFKLGPVGFSNSCIDKVSPWLQIYKQNLQVKKNSLHMSYYQRSYVYKNKYFHQICPDGFKAKKAKDN